MARERNSRRSSCEEAYRRDKRTRQSATLDWKFEVAFCLLEVFDRLVSTVGAISPGSRLLNVAAPQNGIGVGILLYRGTQAVDILKIATFNINGIRSRLPALLEWLEREDPDVVCLQELKAPDAAFPTNDAVPRRQTAGIR